MRISSDDKNIHCGSLVVCLNYLLLYLRKASVATLKVHDSSAGCCVCVACRGYCLHTVCCCSVCVLLVEDIVYIHTHSVLLFCVRVACRGYCLHTHSVLLFCVRVACRGYCLHTHSVLLFCVCVACRSYCLHTHSVLLFCART